MIHLRALPAMPQSMADMTLETPTSGRSDYSAHHLTVQRAMLAAGIAAGQLDASNAIRLQLADRERREWSDEECILATRSSITLPVFDWPGRLS